MCSKSKKGRNPGAVDNWLDSIGLYRKNVAYDETCLFRAISEQLYDCQIYHERVRRECIDFARNNYHEFYQLLEEDEWHDHLDLLEKHMVICGNIEIQIVSKKFDRDVLIFDAAKQLVLDIIRRNMQESPLMLCLMNEDHYDVVYKREHIHNAGFCQSIVYNILYEKVFKIDNVQHIVHGMLYEKEFVASTIPEINNNLDGKLGDTKNVSFGPPTNVAPFPFKVAKALDSTIYRNIEYDSWTEVRREMRLGEWYYGDDNLILGTRCVLNQANETYECYIQEIIKSQNKCVVYVTKLAEKRTVNYTDLSPEDDAKPWPLPFRFSKNLSVVASSSTTPPAEKSAKTTKKRKDKRRTKSTSESSVLSPAVNFSENQDQDINSYVGIPLQMQNGSEIPFSPDTKSPPQEKSSQHNLLVTPDVPSPMPKFTWEAPWNPPFVPVVSDQVVWSHQPSTPAMVNFGVRPMSASAPVTPDVMAYPNNSYPLVFNYQVDNYNTSWQSHSDNSQIHDISQSKSEENKDVEAKSDETSYQQYPETYNPPPMTLCTTLQPPSSQMEVYSPVMFPPGTPVIYAHTPEIGEVMMPGTPIPAVPVYAPPVEVQYLSPGPYLYPPTPPTAWYPPGINAQGFIFPPQANQNVSQ